MVGPDSPIGWPTKGIWMNERGKSMSQSPKTKNSEDNFADRECLDTYHDIQQQMFNAFDIGD